MFLFHCNWIFHRQVCHWKFWYITDFDWKRLKQHIKLTLLILLILATACFVWLMMICLKILPHQVEYIYVAVILATSINFCCCPLFFEMAVEMAYPVNEGLVGGFLTGVYNLIGIMFLFIFFIPNIGFVWINYVLVGSTALAIPAVIMIKESYNRSNVDEAFLNNNHWFFCYIIHILLVLISFTIVGLK